MKTNLVTRSNQRGSVLVVALIITFILGVTLASYLIMTQGQNLSVVRSQVWNRAFALTEAGVEDALAMMNKYAGKFENLHNWTNLASLTADNWSVVGLNVYYTRRFIGTDYYDVYITNSTINRPTIRSMGTVAWNYSYASAPQGFLAAVSVSNPSTRSLNRTVDVQTKVDPLFNFALAAEHVIELNGNDVATDSFDSSDTNYSTAGMYDPNKNKAGGDVVSNDTIQNALNVGNAQIKGSIKTGPKGTFGIEKGSVGDEAWVDGGNIGVQDGHYADDMNVVWDPVILPDPKPVWAPVLGNPGVLTNYRTNGITYDFYFILSGDYQVYGGYISRGVLIAPNVNVRLWVPTGDIKIPGTGEIRIPVNASLEIFMGGAVFSVAGSGIVNESGYAVNFQYYGLPTNTRIDFQGNGDFTGCIYAPNADFYLGGGGSGMVDFIGSSITKNVTLKGHYNFHYDEALRNFGPGKAYLPTNWKES